MLPWPLAAHPGTAHDAAQSWPCHLDTVSRTMLGPASRGHPGVPGANCGVQGKVHTGRCLEHPPWRRRWEREVGCRVVLSWETASGGIWAGPQHLAQGQGARLSPPTAPQQRRIKRLAPNLLSRPLSRRKGGPHSLRPEQPEPSTDPPRDPTQVYTDDHHKTRRASLPRHIQTSITFFLLNKEN